jgi:hypothetical protein
MKDQISRTERYYGLISDRKFFTVGFVYRGNKMVTYATSSFFKFFTSSKDKYFDTIQEAKEYCEKAYLDFIMQFFYVKITSEPKVFDMWFSQKEYNLTSFKIYNGEKDKIERKSKRTTSQFVFAMGMNNVMTEGESLSDSDFRFWRSKFYEWGFTYNTRILENNNLLHAKYGLSLMYNNLRPTDNRYFVTNGNQTDLVTGATHFDDSRFRNVFLVAPMHLEFDFTPKKTSKDGTKTYLHTHESVRLGIGGYAGVRIKSKQILKYEIDDLDIKERQKGDFNVNDFTAEHLLIIFLRTSDLCLTAFT